MRVRRIEEKVHDLKRDLTAIETRNVIAEATLEIRQAAGVGQLIIVVVFLPIF